MDKHEYLKMKADSPDRVRRRIWANKASLGFVISNVGASIAVLGLVAGFRDYILALGFQSLLNFCLFLEGGAMWYAMGRSARFLLTKVPFAENDCKVGELVPFEDGSGYGIVCCRKRSRGNGDADFWFCKVITPRRKWVTTMVVRGVVIFSHVISIR